MPPACLSGGTRSLSHYRSSLMAGKDIHPGHNPNALPHDLDMTGDKGEVQGGTPLDLPKGMDLSKDRGNVQSNGEAILMEEEEATEIRVDSKEQKTIIPDDVISREEQVPTIIIDASDEEGVGSKTYYSMDHLLRLSGAFVMESGQHLTNSIRRASVSSRRYLWSKMMEHDNEEEEDTHLLQHSNALGPDIDLDGVSEQPNNNNNSYPTMATLHEMRKLVAQKTRDTWSSSVQMMPEEDDLSTKGFFVVAGMLAIVALIVTAIHRRQRHQSSLQFLMTMDEEEMIVFSNDLIETDTTDSIIWTIDSKSKPSLLQPMETHDLESNGTAEEALVNKEELPRASCSAVDKEAIANFPKNDEVLVESQPDEESGTSAATVMEDSSTEGIDSMLVDPSVGTWSYPLSQIMSRSDEAETGKDYQGTSNPQHHLALHQSDHEEEEETYCCPQLTAVVTSFPLMHPQSNHHDFFSSTDQNIPKEASSSTPSPVPRRIMSKDVEECHRGQRDYWQTKTKNTSLDSQIRNPLLLLAFVSMFIIFMAHDFLYSNNSMKEPHASGGTHLFYRSLSRDSPEL
eukprot:scaffold323596_cov53-Attheya_sp.AAC.1